MSLEITVPHRLQTGTTWLDAISLININFNNYASDVAGFGVTTLGSVFSPLESFSISPGFASGENGTVMGQVPNAQVAGVIPQFKLYIDPPDPTNPDANYLWPNGSALSANQKKFFFSVYSTTALTDGSTQYTDPTGVTWYPYTDICMHIMNKDTVSHQVAIEQNYILLSAPGQTTFR